MFRKPLITMICALLLSTALACTSKAATLLDAGAIKAGLRTATPEEGGFIERAVRLAKQGTLPPDMLESTFQWARRKPAFRFQHFKRGLTLRAARIGVAL